MELRRDQVERACRYARAARIDAILPHLNAALPAAEIDSALRAAMWLAQLGHETCDFQFFTEIWGNTAAQLGYEGRADLGNTQKGDGYFFRGRGAIQTTGRANYTRLATRLGIDCIAHPDLVALPENAFHAAALYWTDHRINEAADKGDVELATKWINGGKNGLEDRMERYDRACEAVGALSLYLIAKDGTRT